MGYAVKRQGRGQKRIYPSAIEWHRKKVCMFDALKKLSARNCLVIQWLGFCAFTAKGPGSTPGQGSKIQQAVWPKQKQNKMKQKPPTTTTKSMSGCPKCAYFGWQRLNLYGLEVLEDKTQLRKVGVEGTLRNKKTKERDAPIWIIFSPQMFG